MSTALTCRCRSSRLPDRSHEGSPGRKRERHRIPETLLAVHVGPITFASPGASDYTQLTGNYFRRSKHVTPGKRRSNMNGAGDRTLQLSRTFDLYRAACPQHTMIVDARSAEAG